MAKYKYAGDLLGESYMNKTGGPAKFAVGVRITAMRWH